MSIVVTDAADQRASGLPPLPARPDLRLMPDATQASARRRSSAAARRSTAVSSLRDPVIRAEVLGDPRLRAGRASQFGGRDSIAGSPPGMSKYGRRRPSPLDQGDCPPTSMPFDYSDPTFLAAAQRVGRHLHRSWIEQALGDVVLQTADGDLVAHRVVLSSASPTLDTLFRQQRPPGADTPGMTAQLDLKDFGRETVADVINFAYAGDLELDSRNIGPVTACARELDFDTVLAICRSYLIDQVDPENVILHYSVAANNDLDEERDSLEVVLCEAYPETAKNRHFPYLPFERLMAILQRPELCADELDVFLSIVSWVDAQRADRLSVAARLLRLVRFQLIQPDVLAREVQAIDWLFNNHECMEPVWEAYKFHALLSAGSSAVQCMDVQTVRDCNLQIPQIPFASADLTDQRRSTVTPPAF